LTARNEATAIVMHDDDIRATLVNVLGECGRQVGKWGIQHHHDGTGPDTILTDLPVLQEAARMDHLAAWAKTATDTAAAAGDLCWLAILLEEVFEAAEESDPRALVIELIQVAAVAVSWAVDVQNRAHPSY
jgi:hypothetical protein